ncbi:CidB/LrgB family autolysis modulator [Avibacterium endocarditidis]|uniref:CidB/LrgB family autolysis modulator n=1 Tax=Avibacterium TaxID=292486 RepID=UPI0039FD5ECD
MIYAYSLLTILVFALAVQIGKRLRSIVFNSFVLTIAMLVGFLLVLKIPYADYMAGNAPLNNLLGLSVVALALPLYEQLGQIKQDWKIILFITALASVLSMFSGALLAWWLGGDLNLIATTLAKSVTTPIAMEITNTIGGIPAVTAVVVLVAGLQGSMFGYLVLKLCKVKYVQSIGLSVGAVSHVLGMVSCMELNSKAGSYASISLVLCGIMSSIFAPLMFNIVSLWIT